MGTNYVLGTREEDSQYDPYKVYFCFKLDSSCIFQKREGSLDIFGRVISSDVNLTWSNSYLAHHRLETFKHIRYHSKVEGIQETC